MEILVMAKELGGLIAKSEEVENLRKFEELLEKDDEAKKLIKAYKSAQSEFLIASKQTVEKEEKALLEKNMLQTYQDMNNSELIRNYSKAKEQLNSLIDNINSIINYSVFGEESCVKSNCSSCCKSKNCG